MDGRQKALTTAHLNRLALVQQRTAERLTTGWDRLGTYDSPHALTFARAAVPVVLGAQQVIAGQTRAYVAQYLQRPIPAVDLRKVTGAPVRKGTDPFEVYQRPFRQVWWRLSEGDDPPDAIAQGRDRLDLTARTDVQLAARATAVVLGTTAAAGIASWVRVADAGACADCSAADGEQLGPGDEFGLHPNCSCGVAPSESPPEPGADGADPEAVDVHEHGELGAYLSTRGDRFSKV